MPRQASSSSPVGDVDANAAIGNGLPPSTLSMTTCSGHGFRSSKPAIRKTCSKRPGDPPAIRPADRAEASRSSQPRNCGRRRAQPCASAPIGNGARASGSTGISWRLFGDGLDDAVHQPAKADELTAHHRRADQPGGADRGRRQRPAEDQRERRQRGAAAQQKRARSGKSASRSAPATAAWRRRGSRCRRVTNARLHRPREILRSQLLQPVSGTTKYFCGTRKSINPPISASFSVPASLQ